MIVPDVNLLLYAYDAQSSCHAKSAAWWQSCLSGTEMVGLAHVVALGFVRIATNPRAYHSPMTAEDAIRHLRSWLARPITMVLEAGPAELERTLKLLDGLGTAGNLTTDAQIAALAIENGAVLHTADADFSRFPGVRWFNPLTGAGNSSPRRSPR